MSDFLYFDKYGQIHDKICYNEEPSSNDGLIHSAVADKLGIRINVQKIRNMYQSLASLNGRPIERLPGKATPYPSRDFFLGAKWFCLDSVEGWNFAPVELPKFNFAKTVASFVLAIGEHRNYLWLHDLRHAYIFMYAVPLQDRAFHLRSENKDIPWIYSIIEWCDRRIPSKTDSGKILCFLKYDILPEDAVFVRVYGENHLITAVAREKRNNE
jgi:hypothetical protein